MYSNATKCYNKGVIKEDMHTLETRQKISKAKMGQVPWNKGVSPSAETRQKISESKKGQSASPATEFKKGQTPWNKGMTGAQVAWNKGKSPSLETRQAISETLKGNVPWNKGKTNVYSSETIKRISEGNKGNKSHLGHKHSIEARKKMSNALIGMFVGEKSSNWKGGITSANKLARVSYEYFAWQSAVFHRDNYTCQICEVYGEYLHADHIKSFAKHPELRYDVNNGRSLCRACHYYITFKRKMPKGSMWGLIRRG